MIIIIGGGISGLTLAYELEKQGKKYILLNDSEIPGGYIQTKIQPPYTLEFGPNTLLLTPTLLPFLKELDVIKDLKEASIENKNRYIFKKGSIQQVPTSPFRLLSGSFLSFPSIFSILKDVFKRKNTIIPNESVYDFVERQFSKEIADYIAAPFIAGIYAGNAKNIMMETAFPELYTQLEKTPSVLRSFFAISKKGRKTTASFSNGLSTLVQALFKKISHYQSDRVTAIQKNLDGYWEVSTHNGNRWKGNTIVFCTPTFHAAELLQTINPQISSLLSSVSYAGVIGVYASFKREQLSFTPKGFGVLYPIIENQWASGTIWNSSIFSDRAPKDEFLTTSFISNQVHPELFDLSIEEVIERTLAQLKRDLGTTAHPVFVTTKKWEKGIPQYNEQLKVVQSTIKQLESDRLYFCSNWVKGIALPTCIQNAQELSVKL
ncbi:MAG: protoporphyrinogen oxidase [Cytophagaceae bacterium]|jgi:oxygen-dependent protoporphyrinogen oxidase|nr:protoporphyrinogen oxidase [Cytophagaceae bacterium]